MNGIFVGINIFQHLNLLLVRFDPICPMRNKPQSAYLYNYSCLFPPEISNTVGARCAPVFLSIDNLSNLFSIQIPAISRYVRYYVFHCLSNLLDPFCFRVSAPFFFP